MEGDRGARQRREVREEGAAGQNRRRGAARGDGPRLAEGDRREARRAQHERAPEPHRVPGRPVVPRSEIQAAPEPLASAPRPCAMLHVLAVERAEAEVRYRVTADIDTDTAAGRLLGRRTEFLDEAAEALSSARRLCGEGHLNVEITDAATGGWCDEASLERAAGGAEGR